MCHIVPILLFRLPQSLRSPIVIIPLAISLLPKQRLLCNVEVNQHSRPELGRSPQLLLHPRVIHVKPRGRRRVPAADEHSAQRVPAADEHSAQRVPVQLVCMQQEPLNENLRLDVLLPLDALAIQTQPRVPCARRSVSRQVAFYPFVSVQRLKAMQLRKPLVVVQIHQELHIDAAGDGGSVFLWLFGKSRPHAQRHVDVPAAIVNIDGLERRARVFLQPGPRLQPDVGAAPKTSLRPENTSSVWAVQRGGRKKTDRRRLAAHRLRDRARGTHVFPAAIPILVFFQRRKILSVEIAVVGRVQSNIAPLDEKARNSCLVSAWGRALRAAADGQARAQTHDDVARLATHARDARHGQRNVPYAQKIIVVTGLAHVEDASGQGELPDLLANLGGEEAELREGRLRFFILCLCLLPREIVMLENVGKALRVGAACVVAVYLCQDGFARAQWWRRRAWVAEPDARRVGALFAGSDVVEPGGLAFFVCWVLRVGKGLLPSAGAGALWLHAFLLWNSLVCRELVGAW
ncbi:hypothetical protein B0H66DRAFT_376611, partial [Apodospora peruviana]